LRARYGCQGLAESPRSIKLIRTTQEIVDSIDTRIRELRQEIKTLDTARAGVAPGLLTLLEDRTDGG